MGLEISWLLPAALIALVAVLAATWRAPRTDRTRAAMLLWGAWLLVTGLTFSFMSGTIHPYYTVALAPAIAALIGTGGRFFWLNRAKLWARLLLSTMVLATAVWSWELLGRTTWLPALRWASLVLGVVLALGLLLPARRMRTLAVVTLVTAMLSAGASGAAYAAATAGTAHTGSIPASGPAGQSGSGGGFNGGGTRPGAGNRNGTPGGPTGNGAPPADSAQSPTSNQSSTSTGATSSSSGSSSTGSSSSGSTSSGSAATGTNSAAGGVPSGMGGTRGGGMAGGQSSNAELTALLKASSTRWSAAVSGATSAADLELASGSAVIALGGWNGSDPAPTLAEFQAYVATGQIHYYIAGGGMGGGGLGGTNGTATDSTQIATWVAAHYTASTVGSSTVYDLTQTATS
jgi:hypothetical protein